MKDTPKIANFLSVRSHKLCERIEILPTDPSFITIRNHLVKKINVFEEQVTSYFHSPEWPISLLKFFIRRFHDGFETLPQEVSSN